MLLYGALAAALVLMLMRALSLRASAFPGPLLVQRGAEQERRRRQRHSRGFGPANVC